jgi:hypothetical protein
VRVEWCETPNRDAFTDRSRNVPCGSGSQPSTLRYKSPSVEVHSSDIEMATALVPMVFVVIRHPRDRPGFDDEQVPIPARKKTCFLACVCPGGRPG